MKKIVHVGQMKSGTTYIQNALSQNRMLLADRGLLYPGELFNQQHACYGLCGPDIPWAEFRDKWVKLAEEMLDEMETTDKDVLISSEALSCMASAGVQNFVDKMAGIDEVVITVRNLQSVLLSGWQQNIKGGGKKNLKEYIDSVKHDRLTNGRIWRPYSFGETAHTWSCHANVSVVIVGDGVNSNNVLENFADACHIPHIDAPYLDTSKKNKSLKREDVELLRFFNKLNQNMGKEDREKYVRWLLKKGFFPAANLADGSRITMSPESADMVSDWAKEEIRKIPDAVRVYGDVSEVAKIKLDDVEEMRDIQSYELLERANKILQLMHNKAAGNAKG